MTRKYSLVIEGDAAGYSAYVPASLSPVIARRDRFQGVRSNPALLETFTASHLPPP
jgi:hypothetical protein